MNTRFNNAVKKTPTGERASLRALQAWQYLIGKAINRQIVKYDELRELMGYPTNNPLSSILGCIMFYCQQQALPPLTLIVVNRSGVPGKGFTAEILENYHQTREKVFNFPWFELMPPRPADFQKAWDKSKN